MLAKEKRPKWNIEYENNMDNYQSMASKQKDKVIDSNKDIYIHIYIYIHTHIRGIDKEI